jgi:glycosyltransferase involved in cell wall biosynthesis
MPGVDLLVLTSASEGMPNVCMEALATGAPVVALALPALDEWDNKVNAAAGGCALTQVPRGDREIERMAHAVTRVVGSAPSRDLISSGARDIFSAEAASSRLAECISGIGRGVR